MQILAAIKAFFGAIGRLADYFNNRQLLDAGKAQERNDAMVAREKRVAEASAARNDPAAVERVRDKRFRD